MSCLVVYFRWHRIHRPYRNDFSSLMVTHSRGNYLTTILSITMTVSLFLSRSHNKSKWKPASRIVKISAGIDRNPRGIFECQVTPAVIIHHKPSRPPYLIPLTTTRIRTVSFPVRSTTSEALHATTTTSPFSSTNSSSRSKRRSSCFLATTRRDSSHLVQFDLLVTASISHHRQIHTLCLFPCLSLGS